MDENSETNHAILVVDDDYGIRISLKEILEDEGYRVLLACNGQEALNLLRQTPSHRPCAILLDLMMPVMDGTGFRAEQIRDPNLASIPVIVLTADGNAASKALALSIPLAFSKPIQLDDLLEGVAKYCPPPQSDIL